MFVFCIMFMISVVFKMAFGFNFLMRFFDSLGPPASILTDFQRFSMIRDLFRQLFGRRPP